MFDDSYVDRWRPVQHEQQLWVDEIGLPDCALLYLRVFPTLPEKQRRPMVFRDERRLLLSRDFGDEYEENQQQTLHLHVPATLCAAVT